MKTVLCGVGLILLGVAPLAASNDASAQPTAAPAPESSDEDLAAREGKTEVITTVTGSLIGRPEVGSPSPVSVVDRERLVRSGMTNLGDVLQQIPAQGNATNAQNNNGGDGSTRINLRSLGVKRTLVLLDGRRVVASGLGADSSVDLGTIPLAMIERVEVLKDGASAIYGSDAIAGVVNLITRTNVSGVEANVYTSTSSKRDGTNYDLSFVAGHSWDHGNVAFSGGYQQQKPVMAGDRGFSARTYTYNYSCSPEMAARGECVQTTLSGSPSSPTGRINTMPNGGPPLDVPGCNTQFCTADGNGGFRNFLPATPTSFGDNYNFQTLNYVVTPSTRVNLFSNGHYDLSRNVHAFFEGQFNRRTSAQQLAETPVDLGLLGISISRDSIYNPLHQDVGDYDRRLTEFGPRTANQRIDTTRAVVGLTGSVPGDVPVVKNWTWEGSYTYGRNDATSASHGNLILSHFANALGPSFHDPANGPQCGTPGQPIPGCVPIDLLHPGQAPDAAKNYLTYTATSTGFNEQHSALATMSGKLVDLPNHGDISLAIGGDYRMESGGFQPDPETENGDTTGNAVQPTHGDYHVFEAFSEMSIVPVVGGDTIKWVELDAAGRAYHFSTFGSGVTGKVSGLVRTAAGLALRGTYSTGFRAPNIGELFAGQADSFVLLSDPCDTQPPGSTKPVTLDPKVQMQCDAAGVPRNSVFGSAQQRAIVGGNPELHPETSAVGTAGVVYEPLVGLDVTLDYWHMNIDHAITALPAATILAQCYERRAQQFCQQITRDPTNHAISRIVDLSQNVGSLVTSGLDFSAAYQHKNAAGTFRHSVEGTYLFKSNLDTGTIDLMTGKEQIIHGRGYYDLGVQPDLKFNIFTTWRHPSGLGAGFNFRFIDSFQECKSNNCNSPANPRRDVAKYGDGDVFVQYGLKASRGTTQVIAGVNNVANSSPPVIYNGPVLNADESAYSFVGRLFYVRLAQLF
jgi:outer membrane receptor protein involved in Fe transport